MTFRLTLCLSILASTFGTLLASDTIRTLTNVNLVQEIFDLSGKNVLVGIMDRGINYEHPAFRNEDGSTRIEYIYDLTDDRGANNTYGFGTIYNKTDINLALTNATTLATRDAIGHGDATAGLVGGNGLGSPNQKYRGMAPNVRFIIVKITSDGAPAHGNQAVEQPFFNPDLIPIGIDFINDKANELNLPVAMLLNLGSIGGPTDGSSNLCRKIDATVGPRIQGKVFVTGAGDDGGIANKATGIVEQGEVHTIEINKGIEGPIFFDLWYAETDRLDVTIVTPTTTFGSFISPVSSTYFDIQELEQVVVYHLGRDANQNSDNNKRSLWIQLNGPAGDYQIQLTGRTISNGQYNATLSPSSIWNANKDNYFKNNVGMGSIWDGATAFHNICPNSYIGRDEWLDIDGFQREFKQEGNLHDIWLGSSTGPTFDGRIGIDIAAPGDRAVAAYGKNSYWATFRGNLIHDGAGIYGMAGAVSSAAPITTGIIALMLELNPTLDAIEIRDILRQTAQQDEFTGNTPNTTWGYGKIDAFAACRQIYETGNNPPIHPYQLTSEAKNEGIELNWTNLSNQVEQFIIERSTDTINYSQIKAVNNTATSFLDKTLMPNVTYYYRVVAQNEFGVSAYSNITANSRLLTNLVEWSVEPSIKIYPNPTSAVLYFSENLGAAQIFNAQGRMVLQAKFAQTMDVAHLPIGVYFIKSSQCKTIKFVKN